MIRCFGRLVGLIVLTCVVLSGCTATTSGFKIDQQQQVVVADADSSHVIKVERIDSTKKNQRLTVQVVIKNQQKTAKLLEYRFYWYNAQGLEIDSDSTLWHTLTVLANEIGRIHAVATDLNAEYFRLYVRTKK
ncbi:MAG: YcfL family protein [Plesiomonas sp.]|uniref:YcfL family protein n=1 Tax=Plesiomonas sp. TaxID=2486279 RepID=UPI003F2DDF0B